MTIPKFQKTILTWYKKNRRDLPWRNTRDPYRILVSEIMLQQTQVSRVIPKYKEFLRAFPSIQALAKAPRSEVLKTWSGLGYWRRALYLQQTAKILCVGDLVSHKKTRFPKNPEELGKLPGIGHYTARALSCFAFNTSEAFLDTNIRRVYLHFFFPKRKNVSDKDILSIAQKAVWKTNVREWHYALFDYGAIVLKNKTINKRSRHYHKQSRFKGSFRFFRTRAVQFLLSSPESKTPKKSLLQFVAREIKKSKALYSPVEIISALLQDNVLKESKRGYFL